MHFEIRGLEKLSFRERQAVVLKEKGLSTDQIAKRLHLSASSVATLLSRAKGKGYEIVCIITESEIGLGGNDFDEEDPEDE